MQPATPSLPLAAACGVQQEASEPLAWPEVTHRELRTATPAAWPAWPAGCSRLATAVARRTAAAGMATRTTGRHTTVATYSDSKLQREVSGWKPVVNQGMHKENHAPATANKQARGKPSAGMGATRSLRCMLPPQPHVWASAACLTAPRVGRLQDPPRKVATSAVHASTCRQNLTDASRCVNARARPAAGAGKCSLAAPPGWSSTYTVIFACAAGSVSQRSREP